MARPEAVDFAALFKAEPNPCVVLTPDLVIQHANDAYLTATTRRRRELIGKHIDRTFPDNPDLLAALQQTIASGLPARGAPMSYDSSGVQEPQHRQWRALNIPIKSADGSITVILHRLEDVTDFVARGELEQVQQLQHSNAELRIERDELAARALRDPLTGALSRSVFHEELTRALARLPRNAHPLAVLFIDLDRLKQVNDSHGHAAGDELIRQTVSRLSASVRPSDAIARFGGDEFVVLLDDLHAGQEAEIIAGRVLRTLSEPCQVAPGVLINPSASVGVALADGASTVADDLLSHADAAMYKAKQRGRGRYELFDPAAYTEATARTQLEAELAAAIPFDQLLLHYQPIFDLATGAVSAVEALLRWRHPTRGMLAADAFIEVAEDSGLLASIGPWVIDQACSQLARWDRQLGRHAPSQIYVNLSVSELVAPGLHESVRASAEAADISLGRLVIEITESGMLDKLGTVTDSVDRFVQLGCHIAIDDFGTGYSALSRLVELPADILKIDQSFVRGLSRGHESAAVIAAILLLAHNLRKTVVAEGVEDAAALATLTELGCEHAQGFFLSRPQAPEAIADQLRSPIPPSRTVSLVTSEAADQRS